MMVKPRTKARLCLRLKAEILAQKIPQGFSLRDRTSSILKIKIDLILDNSHNDEVDDEQYG